MDEKKAHNISIVMTSLGVIFLVITAFDFDLELEQGFLFTGVLCFFAAIGARLIAERDKNKK